MQAPAPHHRSARPDIILVGASVRAAAASLQIDSQHACVGIDLFGDRDTQKLTSDHHRVRVDQNDWKKRLGDFLDQYPNLPIFCVGRWPGMIEAIEQAGHAQRLRPRPSLFRDVSCPGMLRQAATVSGMRRPETILVDTADAVDPSRRGRWLVKQLNSSGGLGVRWADHVCGKQNRLLGLGIRADINQQLTLQRWIAGRVMGATFLCDSTQAHLLGVCRSSFTRLGEFPFVYSGSAGPVGPEYCNHVNRDQVCRAADWIRHSTGLRGLMNLDFIIDLNGQTWLLEVNPRWSASMELVEQSIAGTRLMSLAVQADRRPNMTNHLPKRVDFTPHLRWIKRIVWATFDSRFDLQTVRRIVGDDLTIRDLPNDGTLVHKRSPICTLVGRWADNPEAFRRIRNVIRKIQTELALEVPSSIGQ